MSYTDVSKVENFLQRELDVQEKALLSFLIPAIKKWIDNKTGSTFDEASETTRYYEGGGCAVDIEPCTAVTAVAEYDNDGVLLLTYVSLTDYVVEPVNETVKREIVRRYGYFPEGQRRIAVTAKFSEFDAGVPQDIQMVATKIAADVILAGKQGSTDVASESLEGHSVTYKNVGSLIDKSATQDPLVVMTLEQRTEIPVY